jgi:phosphoglycolate phosphatase-like HAD superfamily hydrolase
MNIPRSVKAISFDGDGTLWDFQKVMRHSLGRVLDELQRTHPDISSRLTIDSMIETRNRVAAELKGQVINLETVRLEAFRRTLVDLGRPDDALTVHLNQVYLRHRFEDLKLYEDVLPVLNK